MRPAPGPLVAPAAPGRIALPAGVAVGPANHPVNDPSTDIHAGSGQAEQSVRAFGNLMVAAWNDGEGFPSGDTQGWGVSTDGGSTWTDMGAPPHPAGLSGFVWTSDPVVALNEKTGAFYFTALCDFANGGTLEHGVGIVKGRFNAAGTAFAWGAAQIVRSVADPDFLDKEWVTADSLTGRVYVSYTHFPANGFDFIECQRSDSAAALWGGAVRISANNQVENGFVQASRPLAGPDGSVYVAYYLIGQQDADFYKVARSVNQGATFSTAAVAESVFTNFFTGAPGYNRDIGIQFPSFAVDRSYGPHRGRLYLAWAESIDWLDDVPNAGQGGNVAEVESGNTAASATAVVCGQTVRGSLASSGDVDFYSLPLVAGQHVIVAVDSMSAGMAIRFKLVASDGTTALTFSTADDGVDAANSAVAWMSTAPRTATYYIRVDADLSRFASPGTYRLRTGFGTRLTERGRDQRDVFTSYSDDGAVWSAPVRVNDDSTGFDDWLPEVDVAPDGGAYCAWYDYRDAPVATDGGAAGVHLAYSPDGGGTWTPLGQVASQLTNWTGVSSNIIPNQGDYMSLSSNGADVFPCWADGRGGTPDVFLAAVPLIAQGLQIVPATVTAQPNRVDIVWQTRPDSAVATHLYRSDNGAPFDSLGPVNADGTGHLAYADTSVVRGHTYTYRLGVMQNATEVFYGQVTVLVPNDFGLAMGRPQPNPANSQFLIHFTLATSGPAVLMLHDLAGRQVYRRDVSFGAGPQVFQVVPDHHVRPGLYILTVRQGGRNASTRVWFLR
ncbi:MAG TPA: T9SS type A sorting domain-containing protein, partial [Candidatus Eisenbacteria bacterium]|nr:T9SS type A sorting domain-containing protein [Candidatus Eisenbacteria bacterium]